ncbi:rhomboid family intramembrane serine protease [Anaerobaca lacustris]|uniref:Rhomboid family intramembrane serine protease n=1 Tax=Anaerobaca lacustris TaxID=3044600 RepID=A0AAW6TV14_9BACT|nr:rhomboid family intramembrane serine protease [Sedimentisphaerales bacterium M17dextr]
MLLPIRVNIEPRRTPYANYVLIAVNIVIFLLQFTIHPQTGQLAFRPWVSDFMLVPRISPWWTFVTYAFLHHDFWHILFNMFFLYLFGKNVNDKLGNLAYAVFYICGAVFSGLGHALLHAAAPVPTLGASGAVAAVTGAYLVLFPQSLLTIIYWFFFIGTIQVPAMYFIALKMIFLDNILARGRSSIAYDAHLAGYAFGIGVTLLMLATRLVSTNQLDLWAMIKRWNRRRRYRDVVADGYDPFSGTGRGRSVEAGDGPKAFAEKQRDADVRDLRSAISRRFDERNLAAAADLYIQLMNVDSDQVLPRQHLLDVANQLASDQRASEAARAYGQFLAHYGSYEHAGQVELMLGILYCRYLHRPQDAVKHLQRAAERLSDPTQIQMCRDELAKLES